MRPTVRSLLLAGAALFTGGVPASAQATHRFHADHVLGTALDVTAVGASAVDAARAADAAKAEVLRLDAILSGWRDDSDLAALNRAEAAPVAPDLAAVLALAERWRVETGGAFDGRLGAVTSARRAGDPARLARAMKALQDAEAPAPTAAFRRPAGVLFDLDGVAKGYVIDQALAAARRAAPRAQGLMVELGGDLRCTGAGPDDGAWRVGCADGAVLALTGGAVATSGSGERDLADADGRAVSHLSSPATGAAAAYLAAATVHAPCAADADALATALCLMPAAEGLALAERLPGVEARLRDADGRLHATSGWSRLAEPAPRLIHAAAPAAWPALAQVTVAYEVPKIEAPKYYAPYIAIWVTDPDRNLVKTLSLLGEKPRYLESNYVWWRRYGRKQSGLDAITKPTHAPGRYTTVWDGSTDAGGRAAPGRYTIHVEAARQDGGHTYESLDVTVGVAGAAAAVAAPKDELGALKVTVGRAGRAA